MLVYIATVAWESHNVTLTSTHTYTPVHTGYSPFVHHESTHTHTHICTYSWGVHPLSNVISIHGSIAYTHTHTHMQRETQTITVK